MGSGAAEVAAEGASLMPSYVSASGIAAGGAPRGSDKRGGGGGGATSGDVASRDAGDQPQKMYT